MSSYRASLVVLFLSLCTLATCWQPFSDTSVGEYDDKCADALATNITSCNKAVSGISSNNFYSKHGLDLICTSACRDELNEYEKAVIGGCPGVTYTNSLGTEYPITEMASTLAFEFKQTCFKHQGQYCNLVLGNLTKNGAGGHRDECNECLLLKMRNTAQFPYGRGPKVYSSIYPSFTSSCGFTGYPVTPSPSPSGRPSSFQVVPTSSAIATQTPSPSPSTLTCTGKTYTVKKGDTCQSVSKSQSVATVQLLMDNHLRAFCANFPGEGQLCIKNQCTTYTVKAGDTCKSVAKAHNISTVQLRSYNPWIDGGCYNFNRTIGTELCVNEPGDKYRAPSSVIGAPAAPTTATAAVPVPSNLAGNSTRNCGEYYAVKKDEDCDTILQKYPISRENFLILNPGLNKNCTNLLSETSYCVLPVSSMENYPGAPGYMPSITKIPWDSLPDATYAPMIKPNVLPIAPGTPKNCAGLVNGDELQLDFPGVSDCKAVQVFWGISANELLKWNPSLKERNRNSTECGFDEGYRYCLAMGDTEDPGSSGAVPSSTPLTSSMVSSSTSISTSTSMSTSSHTTESMSTAESESSTTTVPSTTMASPTSDPTSTTTNDSVPSPTQSNSISKDCNKYEKAKEGDNCVDFAKDHAITPERLYEWNTVLGDGGKECDTMFQKGTYYCIGISD